MAINIAKLPSVHVKLDRPKRKRNVEKEINTENTGSSGTSEKSVNVNIEVESIESVEKFINNVNWGDYDVAFLVDTLLKLSEVITGVKLFPYQQALQHRVFWSILLNDSAIITGLISRQGGKSQTIACTITTLCVVMPGLAKLFPEQLGVYERGFWVGVYAPVQEQADTIYAKVLATAKSTHAQEMYKDPGIDTKISLHGCKWDNGSFVHRQSANPKSQIESKTWHFMVLEESQGLTEEVIDQKLMPMLAWTAGTSVMIGTVVEEKVPFFNQIELNRASDIDKPSHLKNHIEFNYENVIKYNARYAKHVESVLKKHTKDSRYFKMSYGLEWQFAETQPITYENIIRYCYAPKVGIVGYTDDPVVISIDLAKEQDLTVTTAFKIPRIYMEYDDGVFEYVKAAQILNWLSTGGMKYTQQRPLIKEWLLQYPNIIAIVVDTTGVGNAVYEEMQQDWQFMCDWYPFVFSSKSKQDLSLLFEEYFYSNRLIIPSDDQARNTVHQKMFTKQATMMKKVTKQNFRYYQSMTDSTPDDYFWSGLLGVWGVHQIILKGMEVDSKQGNLYRPSEYVQHSSLEARRIQIRSGEYKPVNLRDQRIKKWGF